MKSLLSLLALSLFACSAPPQNENTGTSFNQATLQAIATMPLGGGYSGTDATKNKLPLACKVAENGEHGFFFNPKAAQPSFCSGASYLVFLSALQMMSPPTTTQAKARVVGFDQKDGHGTFGRWNANGPGCAKLVADLKCGENFTSWERAQPGDFLKIWWNEHIGGRERGHHVVYLGHDQNTLRYWSSNLPDGYGEKSIPRTNCKRVLFTRITSPRKINQAFQLPASDPWLERMLRDDFSWEEVRRKCRVQD